MNSVIPEILSFTEFGDSRGQLVAVESHQNIPFDIKRTFWIYGSEGDIVRGEHANKKTQLVLVCVSGACHVRTIEPSGVSRDFQLDSPTVGLYLPAMVWKEMYDFSADAVLLALASEHYDPSEYIRSIDEWTASLSER